MWADDNALISWDYAYQVDLATGFWSRFTSNTKSSVGATGSFGEGWAIYDSSTKRIYSAGGALFGSSLAYVDLATKSWKTITRTGPDSNATGVRTGFVDLTRKLLVLKQIPDPYSSTPGPADLVAIDLTTGNGPASLPLAPGTAFPSHDNRWDLNPADGCWYSYSGDGTNVIDKLTPPSGTTTYWAFSKVTISLPGGATLPPKQDVYGANGSHYTRFFYVPALQCFAWVSGTQTQVALIKL
jgi:hypothetical protein